MSEIFKKKLSRREFLGYTAFAGSAAALSSVALTKSPYFDGIPKDAPTIEDYIKNAELIKNPIARSAWY